MLFGKFVNEAPPVVAGLVGINGRKLWHRRDNEAASQARDIAPAYILVVVVGLAGVCGQYGHGCSAISGRNGGL